MTYPVRIVTPNAATENLNAQQARQAVRNAMPALHASRRQATELEEAVNERAEEPQAQGFVLIYFMDAETKEFTGFSRIHKPE